MKPYRALFLAVFCLVELALAADKVALSDLAKDPKRYDGKTVETVGVVGSFKQRTSRIGNRYFTFLLKEGDKAQVSVYSRGEADAQLKDGVKAKVVGVFREEKKVQDFTVKNEIDASKVKDKPNGVEIVK